MRSGFLYFDDQVGEDDRRQLPQSSRKVAGPTLHEAESRTLLPKGTHTQHTHTHTHTLGPPSFALPTSTLWKACRPCRAAALKPTLLHNHVHIAQSYIIARHAYISEGTIKAPSESDGAKMFGQIRRRGGSNFKFAIKVCFGFFTFF